MTPRIARCARLLAVAVVAFAAAVLGAPFAARGTSPGTVFLRTVPATAGVRIDVGSTSVTTGSDGTAVVSVGSIEGIAHTVGVARQRVDRRTTVTLSRVQTAPHSVAHQSNLAVGLNVTSQVRLQISQGRTDFAPSSIRIVRVHSINGKVVQIDPQRTLTLSLMSRRTTLRHNVLTAQRVTWSIDRINAGPGVALTAAQPRFDPVSSPTWPITLKTMRGTVDIQTVPATPDVAFLLDGASLTTGPDGRVRAPINDLNDVARRLRLDSSSAGALTVSVSRVSKQKQVKLRERRLVVALSTRRDVSLRFTDLAGRAVSPQRISAVRLKGNGYSVDVSGARVREPVALLAGVATQVNAVWQPRTVTYAVSSVALEGGDAVFAGKQRFDPATSTWLIKLAVFDVSVTTHDALFGTRISTRAVVTRPDGTSYPVSIGAGTPTVISSMVRGTYGFKVDSAAVGGRSTMLVSRDDAVDIRVITALDVAVVLVVGLALIISVVLSGRYIGRRHARVHNRRGTR
jgi:hypothetical protein